MSGPDKKRVVSQGKVLDAESESDTSQRKNSVKPTMPERLMGNSAKTAAERALSAAAVRRFKSC